MIECLRDLTQENLSVHTKLDEQRTEISELKEQLKMNGNIENRALRSIENEAEIKTRLHRYEKYVSDLKMSIHSFKKIQSEKFNYILAHNYKEYQALKEKYEEVMSELRDQ